MCYEKDTSSAGQKYGTTSRFPVGPGSDSDNSEKKGWFARENRIYSYQFKDYDSSVQGNSYFELVQNGCFPELGEGVVDFDGVCQFMRDSRYCGWVVVEQDILPDVAGDQGGKSQVSANPLQSAIRNLGFMRQMLGREVRDFEGDVGSGEAGRAASGALEAAAAAAGSGGGGRAVADGRSKL